MPVADLVSRWAVGTAAILLMAGCGGPAPSTSDSVTSAPDPAPTRSLPAASDTAPPAAVSVPAIGVEEDVIDLGIDDRTGQLEVPSDPAQVGWFEGGGRPGGPGPTVVVGHLDSDTGPAVFARVPDLGPGDEISVTSTEGDVVVYEVTEVADFPQLGGFPTEAVFGATIGDELRLITCTGPYDQRTGRYMENRVVFAVPR